MPITAEEISQLPSKPRGIGEWSILINNGLKSDHYGIEISNRVLWWFGLYPVKIRPLWDWNSSYLMLLWIASTLLKSDHYGIEIQFLQHLWPSGICVKIRPLWDWNLIASTILSKPLVVKIRPLWDWNSVNGLNLNG